MTFDNSAWAIDGPQILSSKAREALFVSTQGQEGVVRGNHLKVTAQAPASDAVNIGDGAGVVLNRSSGGAGQSYSVNNSGTASLNVNPTSGGSRSDLIVVEIHDPEFSPWDPPAEGEEDTYPYIVPKVIYNVPSNTTSFADLGLGYSALALARIDRPGGTALVTGADIVDLRQLAQPRTYQYGNSVESGTVDFLNALPAFTWEHFPSGAHFPVYIPPWATKVFCMGYIDSLDVKHPGIGALCVTIDPAGLRSEMTNIQTLGSDGRVTYVVGGTIDIPAELRGTHQGFFCTGRVATDASAGMLQGSTQSTFTLLTTFSETIQ